MAANLAAPPWWRTLMIRTRRAVRRRVAVWLPLLRRGDHAFIVAVAIIIGVLSAYAAIGFRELLLLTHRLTFQTNTYSLDALAHVPWWLRLLAPTVGGVLVGLIVTRFSPEVRGSGIPEVMEAVARRGGLIRYRVMFTKAVAATLTIGTGGSAGREGPIVHMGSAIGSGLGQLLQVSPKRLRTFVGCGAAASIAATFNAPIAGALFAMEVVLGDLAVAHLSPIVISSVIATVISRHYLGDFPAFNVPGFTFENPKELVLYALLGAAAALVGVAFHKLLYRVGDVFEQSKLPAWARPAVGGLGVGLIALVFPHVFGVGYPTINGALWARLGAPLLIVLLAAKMLATSLTLGAGGSGGVFAPSLFLGATLGAAWGSLAQQWFPSWTSAPSAYALVAMGAVVSATTHAPITAILIIFEMTNDYRSIPPLMLTCVISVLLSGLLTSESIYTSKLVRRGVKLNKGRDVNLLRTIDVQEVMTPAPPTIHRETKFAEIVPRLLTGEAMDLVVVDHEQRLVGVVSLADVRAALPDAEGLQDLLVAADLADESIPHVVPSDNLSMVMQLFGKIHRDALPVCESVHSRRVVGLVTRSAVIETYNRRIFQMDLSGSFRSLVDAVRDGRMIQVFGAVYLSEVEVPAGLVGENLREARVRERFGLEVVLIRSADHHQVSGGPGRFPKATDRLAAGDVMLVMGSQEAIEAFRE